MDTCVYMNTSRRYKLKIQWEFIPKPKNLEPPCQDRKETEWRHISSMCKIVNANELTAIEVNGRRAHLYRLGFIGGRWAVSCSPFLLWHWAWASCSFPLPSSRAWSPYFTTWPVKCSSPLLPMTANVELVKNGPMLRRSIWCGRGLS